MEINNIQTMIYNTIMEPHMKQGHNVISISGSRKDDIVPVTEGEKRTIRPLMVLFMQEARKKRYLTITYSYSRGVTVPLLSEYIKGDADRINNWLNQHNLLNRGQDIKPEEEFIRFIRNLYSLIANFTPLLLSDGTENRLIVSLDFAEHPLAKKASQNSNVMEKVSVEVTHSLITSLGLRRSKCILLLQNQIEGMINDVIRSSVPSTKIPLADINERRELITTLNQNYQIQTDLDTEEIVSLSENMTNRSIEKLFYASSEYKTQLTSELLVRERKEDIIRQSQGTLIPIDTSQETVKLVGRNIEKPSEILNRKAEAARHGRLNSGYFVILGGPPSGAKTTLAIKIAKKSGLPAFMIGSIKDSLVGESEKRADIMLERISSMPGVYVCDEIDSLFQLDRSQQNNDSGVSAAISAKLLSFFGNPEKLKNTIFIGTTNRPHLISVAMRSRFDFIPVLGAVRDDYPIILETIVKRLGSSISHNEMTEEGYKIYDSGLIIRDIEKMLQLEIDMSGRNEITLDLVKNVANSTLPAVDMETYIHTDLISISKTKSKKLLPFIDNQTLELIQDYPLPQHILEILNKNNEIDYQVLYKRINELEKQANV